MSSQPAVHTLATGAAGWRPEIPCVKAWTMPVTRSVRMGEGVSGHGVAKLPHQVTLGIANLYDSTFLEVHLGAVHLTHNS